MPLSHPAGATSARKHISFANSHLWPELCPGADRHRQVHRRNGRLARRPRPRASRRHDTALLSGMASRRGLFPLGMASGNHRGRARLSLPPLCPTTAGWIEPARSSCKFCPFQPTGRAVAGHLLPAPDRDCRRASADFGAGRETSPLSWEVRAPGCISRISKSTPPSPSVLFPAGGCGVRRSARRAAFFADSTGSAASRQRWWRASAKRGCATTAACFLPIGSIPPPSSRSRAACDRNLNLPAGALVALYSGNMGEKQGVETLADVAALACRWAGASSAGGGRCRRSRGSPPRPRAWRRSTGSPSSPPSD